MLTLKLFGPPAIEAVGGLVTGRAAQGHRLALLAVLALARGRAVPRDKLSALLWPESPTERARPQLSDALYILRTAFGADVIRSTGDELLLNGDQVQSDVGSFERLLDDRQMAAAVDLFAGPLLDGFHLSDGAEFEHWLEVERARLGQRHAAALESLAEASEARRDDGAAVAWWRRLAAHDPYSGRVALRLMRALDAAGDRAGALRHARLHATLLREEFATGPDPHVAALAERLRTEPSVHTDGPVHTEGPQRSRGPALPAPTGAQPAADGPAGTTPESVLARGGEPSVSNASTPPGEIRREPTRRPSRGRRLGAAVTVVALVALAWNAGLSRVRETPAAAARSLAVLPFVNMSADPANGYFSDGLSEQIITTLSRVEGLRVAARTSAFALRGGVLDVRAIGDTLGVESVLEGSVRREGSRLRVTAQLIDAETGYHVWSGEYDREVADVIAVQDEIARAIADALELRLPPRAAARARRPPDLAAYDLYLRALQLRNALNADALGRATDLLDRSIELEPGFALAWAARASVVAPRIYFRQIPMDVGVPEVRAAVDRALELDPGLGEAHVARGIVKLFFEWDWDGAERALRQAVRLNPSDPHAWHHLANYLRVMGRMEESVDARTRSVALDPLNARTRIVLASDYRRIGRLDEARRQYERARALDPMNPLLLGLGPALPAAALVFLPLERPDSAVQELLRVAALRGASAGEVDAMRGAFAKSGMPGFWRRWLEMDLRQSGRNIDPLRVAILWAAIGDADRAVAWLERAHHERNPGLIYLASEPNFRALRAHPRVARILRAMRLPAG